MFYDTEVPQVYSTSGETLEILQRPIKWFKPFLTGLGQMILYRLIIKRQEIDAVDRLMESSILSMDDGTEIEIGTIRPSERPRAVVLYLHTVCGNYTQQAHMGEVFHKNDIAFVSYTRAGNDTNRKFSKFNFVGRIDELQLVLSHITQKFPGVPIHAIGASAGSALLIRYLGKYNKSKIIKSAVLVSPGYDFMKSLQKMNIISKAYLVNKMKHTIRDMPCQEELKSVRTLDDWVKFQSQMLGYTSLDEYVLECNPVHYLKHINVPSLFISSLDDRIFDGDITQSFMNLPNENDNIVLVITKRGGHVIFEDEGHDIPWFVRVARDWIQKKII